MNTISRHFASDNNAGICAEAWAALAEANAGHAPGYGDDAWTARAADLIRDVFETNCEVFFVFNFLPRPRCFPQEREAGFHGRIELKTADRNSPAHFTPTMPLHQLIEYFLQRDAVQKITGMLFG